MPGSVVALVVTPRLTDIPHIPCGLERTWDNGTAIDLSTSHSVHDSQLATGWWLGRTAVRAAVDDTPQVEILGDGY
ncbi:hypothetical protein BSFA1_86200 (plasmid) [Burkholderia sp. SFA1]|nr:hypothetical protein BSFA1_86200 [Burkholderia sp. SFA1]